MIAMAILFLIFLYIVLFIVAGVKAQTWSMRFVLWGLLLAPLIWKTWDIPVGYYRFQKLCEAEAGFKVYVSNPAPARIIRMDGYLDLYVEETLKKRPSIVAIEAKDNKEYKYLSNPIAFSLYERSLDGSISSRLLDKVGKTVGERAKVLETVPSRADYVFTRKRNYDPSNRLTREAQELRSRDGTLIGSSVSLDYMWSNPANSLFASSFHTNRCGSWELFEESSKLLDLVASR